MTNFVVPIPPSYDSNQKFSKIGVFSYLDYLQASSASVVMTTAGTSQFGLLDLDEIRTLNNCVVEYAGKKIIGLPQLPNINIGKFVESSLSDDKTYFMGLYPDRFYDNKTIIDYFSGIRDHTANPIYVHGMFMRAGRGGHWNFTSDVLSELFDKKIIIGIKEENSDLLQAYNVIRDLPKDLDVIVAGGSMRRHQFLRSAGANAFLSGVGSIFPAIERSYCSKIDNSWGDVDVELDTESILFSVFNRHGWHRSLRIALSQLQSGYFYDRMPWPSREASVVEDIKKVLKEIQHGN